jgi:hypothetical protein
MIICRCCGADIKAYLDYIFDHEHEFADCDHCDCLFVKNIDSGEWVESSTLNLQSEIGRSTGHENVRGHKGCTV